VDWVTRYRRDDLIGDLMAGVIVAIMLVPQGMAYALLAGLPPQAGLYASIVPLLIYSLLGTSRTLSVAPVAIMSMITASGVGAITAEGGADYVALALTLAMMLGVIQIVMGVARLGFLVNFLSHPVLSGFMNGAALVIGASQLKHLIGVSAPNSESLVETMRHVGESAGQANLTTLGIGLFSIGLLVYFKRFLGNHLERVGVSPSIAGPMAKSGPLAVVLLGTVLVWGMGLHDGADVRIVGDIPGGLPPLAAPSLELDHVRALLPTAITLSLVGFMESISVAKSLASKRRQKVDANQELLALGAANVGASFTGGFPVTGGLSRSVVNFSAGANTGLASILTAALVLLTVLFLTPAFYYLPQAVLSAIVVVAVAALIDFQPLAHAWRVNRADAASLVATFLGVVTLGVESGIIAGIVVALALHIWRTSRPHIAIVGRVDTSESYRNTLRHDVTTCPGVVAVRIDESLYFANTAALEDTLLGIVADQPETRQILLIGSAINAVDASAVETLESLRIELRDAGVELALAEIKGPVMDQLRRSGFIDHLGAQRVFLTTHQAMRSLGCP
jgi:SulP family sulfate permease